MPDKYKHLVQPNDPNRSNSVRGAYVHNLVDCLHACLLRGDLDRASRAWAILVRCPDVNWRDRWQWGLYLLSAQSGRQDPSRSQAPVQTQTQSQYTQAGSGREAERWLKSLQVSASEADKPSILAELVLHLIKVGRFKDALSELEIYLTSFPYLLSASLHTYAGLLCFYLAQPAAARLGAGMGLGASDERGRDVSVDSDITDSSVDPVSFAPPNEAMVRQARALFAKALEIDRSGQVARGFLDVIDKTDNVGSDDEMELDESPHERGRRVSLASESTTVPSVADRD